MGVAEVSGSWCRMPSINGYSTLWMAWCRATITLTLSRTHSIGWRCCGGSRFPTRTPPQPPSARYAVLLFPHPPPRPYRHLVYPRSHLLSVTCRIYIRQQMPTSKWNNQERNEKWQRNHNTNENLAQKPTLSNLPRKSPPLIFRPICNWSWLSRVQSLLIILFAVGVETCKSCLLRWNPCRGLTSWCSRSCVLRVQILQVHFSQSYPRCALLVPSKCTLVKCASLPCAPSVLLSSDSTSPRSPLLSAKSTSLLLEHPPPASSHPRPKCCLSLPSALLSGGGEKKLNFPSLALCVKHILCSRLRSPSASLCSTQMKASRAWLLPHSFQLYGERWAGSVSWTVLHVDFDLPR